MISLNILTWFNNNIIINKCRGHEGNTKLSLDKHHSNNCSGITHQRMLKLMGECLRRNRIFT